MAKPFSYLILNRQDRDFNYVILKQRFQLCYFELENKQNYKSVTYLP